MPPVVRTLVILQTGLDGSAASSVVDFLRAEAEADSEADSVDLEAVFPEAGAPGGDGRTEL